MQFFFILVNFLYCNSNKNSFLAKLVLQTYNLLKVFGPKFQAVQFAIVIDFTADEQLVPFGKLIFCKAKWVVNAK